VPTKHGFGACHLTERAPRLARGNLRATVVAVAALMAIPGLIGLAAPSLSPAHETARAVEMA